jgi:hypothetical protein
MDACSEKDRTARPPMEKIKLFVASAQQRCQDIVLRGEEEDEGKLCDGKET